MGTEASNLCQHGIPSHYACAACKRNGMAVVYADTRDPSAARIAELETALREIVYIASVDNSHPEEWFGVCRSEAWERAWKQAARIASGALLKK